MSSSVARPSNKTAPRGGRQQRRGSAQRTARPPTIAQAAAEPERAPVLDPVSEPMPVPTPLRTPSTWRRWAYLASALADLLFMLYAASGMPVSYAKRATPGSAGFGLTLLALIFYGLLLAGLVANTFLGLGLLRAYYRALLGLALISACYCNALLGLSALATTLRLGAGFLEPLWIWQLLIYQVLVLLGAWEHAPPSSLRLLARWADVIRATRYAQRLQRAVTRAVRAFTTGSDE